MAQTRWQQAVDFHLEKHIWTKRDGLPDWFVRQFFQDRDGLIWIITNAGIHTFDGLQFRKVLSEGSLPDLSSVTGIAEDVAGNIWLVKLENDGKYIRPFVLDRQTWRTIPLHQYIGAPQPIVLSTISTLDFLINRNGIIWISSKEGLFRFDGSWKQVGQLRKSDPKEWFYPAPDTLVWSWSITSQIAQLKLLNAFGNTLDSIALDSASINVRWVDNDLDFWIGKGQANSLETRQFVRFSARNRKIQRDTSTFAPTNWFNDNITASFLNRLIPQGFAINYSGHSKTMGPPDNPKRFDVTNHLPDLVSSSRFFVDQTGGLWTSGTYGLMRFFLRPKLPFNLLLNGEKPEYSVRTMAEWDKYLFVNTYRGSKRINVQTGQFENLNLPGDQIGLSALIDSRKLLIGTYQQLLLECNLTSRVIEKKIGLGIPVIHCLHKSASGHLFAGTNAGLFRLNTKRDTAYATAIKDPKVVSLLNTEKGIWVGTSKGLYLINESGDILREALLPDSKLYYDYISHIYEASSGVLWLSTKGAGLIKWDHESDQTQIFDINSGLSNNNIHAIYPDSAGNFWLPSDFGLMCFHPDKGVVRTYFQKDGLASDEFNLFAHLKSADGRLYLGGIDGITAFYPNEIPTVDHQELRLKAISASAFEVETGSFVQKNLPTYPNEALTLEPSDAYLEISVSPMVFEANETPNTIYGWKVEGFHESWVEQSSNIIRISNLPYGKHLLKIRCRRIGNHWSSHELTIPVTVLYPYYLRWPFIIATTIGLGGIAFLISYLRNRQLQITNRRLEEEVAKRTRQIEQNLFTIESDRKIIEIQSQELRAQDEMKSRFFANIAHELRTPLTLILGPIDSLLHQQSPGSTSSSVLPTVRQHALKLLNLVEELLDLSKIDAQKIILEERPVVFFNFLSRLVAAFTPYARHRNIELRLLYDYPVDFTLMLDPNKWEKIVNNLLSNALKFTLNGGKITLHASSSGPKMLVRVSDTGQGIHPDDLPFVFDRFFQSKNAQSEMSGGTGIGLSLCKEYARLFGGELSVESTLGQGAIFSLLFTPNVVGGPEINNLHAEILRHENPRLQAAETHGDPQRGKSTILVVEDDPFMMHFIQSILEGEYHIQTADNGKKAIQVLENSTVDLLLSDIMMPEMDGYLLLENVRASHPMIPFVMLTARSENGDRLKALRLGVDDYISKPFFQEELTARIRNLINRYKTRKEAQQGTALEQGSSHDQLWLQQLEKTVKANLHDPEFSVRTLSEMLNITERTLQNKLKAFVGISPSEYITEARLVEAKHLLENRTYATVSEVCFAVGFKTPRHFAGKLKNRFGRMPSSFQKSN
jgi:signal transduction histidine kinase/DNA-binding response OmpR family regulator/ligand-binding sensor domain-containing protein